MEKSTDTKKIERRGGARPNTGGVREGAGRPTVLKGDRVKRGFRIAIDIDREIDNYKRRGFNCPSQYVDYLLRKGLKAFVD
jgi:hypothetical protein